MASPDYYDPTENSSRSRPRLNAPLPPTPAFDNKLGPNPPGKDSSSVAVSPIGSPFRDDSGAVPLENGRPQDPFSDNAAIPLQPQFPLKEAQNSYYPAPYGRAPPDPESRPRDHKKRRRFTKKSPWFIYFLTLIQVAVFLAEVIKYAILTGSPIETSPTFNPMIGPSPYLTINMGARFTPCMRNEAGIQDSSEPISLPCPGQVDNKSECTLSELCGFGGVPNPHVNGSLNDKPAPNQWFRFIVPIFLHAGLIHITFNMLLQVLLGGAMERAIGPLRLALVYFSSGIFGFVFGGVLAPSGMAPVGASGAIFGIIALTLLDLLYTWSYRRRPVRDLCFILLDIIISFVIGLLPGVDNFSHIGGFLMGLVLGVCLLRSPTKIGQRNGNLDDTKDRQDRNTPQIDERTMFRSRPTSTRAFSDPRGFFSNRRPLWWAWWLIRLGALAGVIVAFAVLLAAFYAQHQTQCSWCKYLSCLPVDGWCDQGQLSFKPLRSSGSSPSAMRDPTVITTTNATAASTSTTFQLQSSAAVGFGGIHLPR